ncbi:MAG: adenylate/guanylate cyclase domain-containing protein [Verrucomicrobiota bacterium]
MQRTSIWAGLVVFLGVGVLMVFPGTRMVGASIWATVNGLVLIRGLLGILFQPRSWWAERGSVGRWAFWPSLMGVLLLRSGLEPLIAEVSGQWLPAGFLYGLSLLLLVPILMGALLWSCLGAGVAAWGLRGRAVQPGELRRGIRIWWLMTLGALVAVVALSRWEGSAAFRLACGMSVPLATLGLQVGMRRLAERGALRRMNSWLGRRLVLQRASGRVLDLRGPVFALVGFLVAWALVVSGALLPVQASALLSEIQFLNASNPSRFHLVLEGDESVASDRGGPSGGRIRLEPPRVFGKVVLLEWDVPTLRTATTTGSEAGVSADLIQMLAKAGALRVVLPTPATDAGMVSSDSRLVPPAAADESARLQSDLPKLVAAVRSAGNVLVLDPVRNLLEPDPGANGKDAGVSRDAFRALKAVALESGSSRMAPMQIAALPALPLRTAPGERPPAALSLAGSLIGATNLEVQFTGPHRARVLGREVAVLDDHPGRLLLDFVTSTQGRDFVRIPFSSVLRDEELFDPSAGSSGAWLKASEFFRGKVVILQSLRSGSVASPWGSLEPTEMLAHGVRTLMGSYFVGPVSRGVETGYALGCALILGRLAVGRNPIKASWRLVLVVLFTFGLSVALLAGGAWLDPVFPSAAALAAFLLVTQLTLAMERTAKERNRFLLDRFVAPEVVDELLEPVETRLGMEGRRERVVVLFADVRGFTQFAEAHSPEEVMTVVNSYLHVMNETLHRHGGILDKYTGDGLMALFRLDRSVSVAQSVTAALGMRDAVLALSADRAAGGDKSLQVGISMHVGEAVVGLVGNPERQVNFTALGHTVVVAARLQTQAAGGEVVVTREVFEEVGTAFEMTPRPAVRVKGVSEPVQPYLVVGSHRRDDPRPGSGTS